MPKINSFSSAEQVRTIITIWQLPITSDRNTLRRLGLDFISSDPSSSGYKVILPIGWSVEKKQSTLTSAHCITFYDSHKNPRINLIENIKVSAGYTLDILNQHEIKMMSLQRAKQAQALEAKAKLKVELAEDRRKINKKREAAYSKNHPYAVMYHKYLTNGCDTQLTKLSCQGFFSSHMQAQRAVQTLQNSDFYSFPDHIYIVHFKSRDQFESSNLKDCRVVNGFENNYWWDDSQVIWSTCTEVRKFSKSFFQRLHYKIRVGLD